VRFVLEHLTGLQEFPASTLFNVNLPPLPAAQVRGIRLTTLGRRVYSDSLMRMHDPRGREIYWIGGGSAEWSGREDSDFRAVREGFVSVTPLHLDLTNYRLLDAVHTWWREP
jgi:5'-nucleotidase